MNERFYELGKEATKWCCHNLPSDNPEWDSTWEQKFAELIVKECAEVVDNDDSSYPYDSFGHKLKQHFGVKE